MSDNNKIYEITQMINNQHAIKGDVNQAAEMVRNMFKEKYVNPITNVIQAENSKAKQNPCKEAQLLHAMKAFMPESKHRSVDQTIDMILMMDTFKNLRSEIAPFVNTNANTNNNYSAASINAPPNRPQRPLQMQSAPADCAIHEDGIYEVDNTCLNRKMPPETNFASMMMLFALMGRR